MCPPSSFDETVGRVAGAIYSDINAVSPAPPLMLVPGITLKVRKALERYPDLGNAGPEAREVLARDIRLSIVPLLFSLDVEPALIERLMPYIERAALKSLESFK
jgi:hypothetical protein